MVPHKSTIFAELKQTRPFHSRYQEAFLALLRTGAVAKRPIVKVVEAAGLSLAQYNVLRILRGSGAEGLPTLAIRERMIEEAAGITRLIDKLEAAGYVSRERTTPDRRLVLCRITKAGLTLLASLDAPVAEADEAVLSALDDDELDHLITLLDKIRAYDKVGVRG
ncbi:MAG TPA: MarR family transcriptional regulator [Gemmatimonadaceae bacterium]|nr:MarR family transcriptional regulator [Gemmatimonadaceae bacterium]